MKSWKTTLSGIIAAVGAAFQISDNPTLQIIGKVLLAIGALFFGISAKDSDVTGGTKQQ